MPPAARVGDKTNHGTSLGPGPGSVNVFIEGKPAWRAGADLHICPQSAGTVAHVGGPVLKGSATVLINGLPAARQGDDVTEIGATNKISAGAQTVVIG